MNFKGKYEDLIQPDKLHVLSVSILLDSLQETRGGVAGNIAYNLALLGEEPILVGSVGESASNYMADLAKLGVDTSCVHTSKLPTATFTVMTDAADCQVGGFYPGAMSDASTLSFKPWVETAAEHLFVISPHDPAQMAHQVQECLDHKLRLFYDVGQQASNISGDDIRQGLEAAELLIVNDYEMGVLETKTGWSQDEITQKVKVVVITLGENGCQIYEQGKTKAELVPAVSGLKVIDPTGAGDAFRAGFLYGYLRSWEVTKCAQLGAVVASYAVESRGTQQHVFTSAQLKERYHITFNEEVMVGYW